jgi:crotonobetainyl-CoA:carnitine CoA-transferase CaiB-like acyl-CoA transferase
MTGYGAVKAVLAGIIGRNKNGKGMYIDVAMFDVQVDGSGSSPPLLNSTAGIEVVRVGTGHTRWVVPVASARDETSWQRGAVSGL